MTYIIIKTYIYIISSVNCKLYKYQTVKIRNFIEKFQNSNIHDVDMPSGVMLLGNMIFQKNRKNKIGSFQNKNSKMNFWSMQCSPRSFSTHCSIVKGISVRRMKWAGHTWKK